MTLDSHIDAVLLENETREELIEKAIAQAVRKRVNDWTVAETMGVIGGPLVEQFFGKAQAEADRRAHTKRGEQLRAAGLETRGWWQR